MATLKTTYKDYLRSGPQKYQITSNADNTYSFSDVTEYSQIGDSITGADINLITTQVNTNTTAIEANKANISVNTSSISTNTSNISSLNSSLSTLSSKVTTNTSNISANATNINTKQTKAVEKTNISISGTPTALSSYNDWDSDKKYGYKLNITISGLVSNSLVISFVASDTITKKIASIVDTSSDTLTVYTKDSTALSGTIYSLVYQNIG